MSKKQDHYHHGDLRAALLEATAEMIAEKGVDKITIRALSERVGVSRAAPYRHFSDKSDLLAAVAEEGFRRLLQRLQTDDLRAWEDPLARFQEMGIAYIQFAVENPAHYRLMFSHESAGIEQTPGLVAAGESVFELLMKTIRECQEEEKIRAGDPRRLSYVAWATVHGLSSLLIHGRLRLESDVQTIAQFTTQALIEGVADA